MQDKLLSKAIATALVELERDGNLVVTSSYSDLVADRIAKAALSVVPNTNLSLTELTGVRNLIFQAIYNKNFFDSEMPVLTGFTAPEFEKIAEKLPRD